jgi:hypothetical protein
MSIARPELKTIEELREWIDHHTSSAGAPDEGGATPYLIVRRTPMSGAADWNVVPSIHQDGVQSPWTSARRHAILTARLLFDVR